jgi:hypothetical protein
LAGRRGKIRRRTHVLLSEGATEGGDVSEREREQNEPEVEPAGEEQGEADVEGHMPLRYGRDDEPAAPPAAESDDDEPEVEAHGGLRFI